MVGNWVQDGSSTTELPSAFSASENAVSPVCQRLSFRVSDLLPHRPCKPEMNSRALFSGNTQHQRTELATSFKVVTYHLQSGEMISKI